MRPVSGSAEWYWCCDYVSGDLYEAEELYQDGHPIKQNRLLFLHYPDGHTVEPIVAHEGQYFGAPGFENGRLQILMADFPAGKIYVFQYNPTPEQLTLRAELSRSAIKDCYNLMFQQSPLMLSDIALKNDSSFSGRRQQSLKLGIPKHFTVGRETIFTLLAGSKTQTTGRRRSSAAGQPERLRKSSPAP